MDKFKGLFNEENQGQPNSVADFHRTYKSSSAMVEYVKSIGAKKAEDFNSLLKVMSLGCRITAKPNPTIAKKGNYKYNSLSVGEAKGEVPYYIPHDEDIERFIFDYIKGKFTPSFTLDEACGLN